ncbi:MAG: MFS transporter [Candidatus Omnitrophica bacterium]|nr:MFS transporter [Candidatus Omnitrophota bacterium]
MFNFYISAFLADLALGAVLLSIPLFLIYMFGATSLTLGVFGAIGSLVYSAGVIIVGGMADRFIRRKILLVGCCLFISANSVLPFLKTTEQVLIAYIVGSASMCMFWPTLQSWLSQGLNKHKLVNSLMIFNISWSAGLMLGFFFAGFLFAFNPKAPFALGVLLVLAVIAFLYRQPLVPPEKNGGGERAIPEIDKNRPANHAVFLYVAWCANFVSWFNVGIMRNLFPKLGTELGFSAGMVGIFIFVITLAQTVMFFILGKTHKWHYKLWLLILFQLFAFFSLLAVAFSSQTAHLIIAMIFLGLSCGMTYFSSIFYSLYGSADKGKKSGLHEAFLSAGAFFGPLAGGFLAQKFGIRAPYIVAAAVSIIAVAAEAALVKFIAGNVRKHE